MFAFISILLLVACILLGLVVLIQDGKEGGLASSFASKNQMMGVRKTADTVEKATWIFAVAVLFFCLMSTSFFPGKSGEQVLEPKVLPTAIPETPIGMPSPNSDALPFE